MNKNFLSIAIVVILICVCLSGCNETKEEDYSNSPIYYYFKGTSNQ